MRLLEIVRNKLDIFRIIMTLGLDSTFRKKLNILLKFLSKWSRYTKCLWRSLKCTKSLLNCTAPMTFQWNWRWKNRKIPLRKIKRSDFHQRRKRG